MSIHVDRTLRELELMAENLGLLIQPSGKNQRFMKEDYIYPIRDVFLSQRYKSLKNIPDHMMLMLQVKSPMLAKRIDELKPQQQKEIWESDNWYFEEKLNGCFEYNTEVSLADGTKKRIGDIVREGKPVNVLSFNEITKKVDVCKAVRFFDNGLKDLSEWLNIRLGLGNRNGRSITVTKNHKIFTPKGFVEAQNLKIGDTVLVNDLSLSKNQISVCIGTLLGDSFLSWDDRCCWEDNGMRIVIGHSIKQLDYYNKKKLLLEPLTGKDYFCVSGYGSKMVHSASKVSRAFEVLQKYFYDNKTRLRRLDPSIKEVFTDLSLAIWYMDDGNMSIGREDGVEYVTNLSSRANISCARYSEYEVDMLLDILKVCFDIEGVKSFYGGYFELRFNTLDSKKFFDIVSRYIPESMEYKLPLNYRGNNKIIWWEDSYEYSLYSRTILNIKKAADLTKHKKYNTIRAFDMEVENNHTYFANTFAVHNCRLWIIKTNSGIHLYSRHNSDVDLLPIEYTDKILFPENFNLDMIKENFIIDTEITSDSPNINTTIEKYGVRTESMLQACQAILGSDPKKAKLIQKQENLFLTFNIFDCVYYEGQWITNEPLQKRRSLAFELWKKLSNAGFKIRPVRSNRSNKKQFYKGIIMNGGEGVVSKRIDGIYLPDTNRQTDGWIKIKRSVSEMSSMEEAFGDTIDGWISGFEPGKPDKGLQNYVGTIKVSTYVKKADGTIYEHEIAYISGIDMKLRTDMTEMFAGIPTLKASYYNKIVEIDGAGVSSRAKRFNHAVLISFKYGKNKDGCVIDEEFLNKLIL